MLLEVQGFGAFDRRNRKRERLLKAGPQRFKGNLLAGVEMGSESGEDRPGDEVPNADERDGEKANICLDPESTDQVAGDREAGSLTRFLYNQNPFYLISCLLVIYGCQSLAVSSGTVLDKSISMTAGLASYTLLMAIISVGVVRAAKVWDDARSIFIVVVISLIATTTGFDELSIWQNQLAGGFALATAALVLFVTEAVLWACRIRLGFWYRIAYYAYFAVLIASPFVLGQAVAERNDPLANWGSVVFSCAIGACILVLIPAVRRGGDSIRNHGTPWNWPLYPLSAFAVMIVLAGIRSHAIWMSFGFYGTAGNFEPFLLMPILAAVVILIGEAGLGLNKRSLQRMGLVVSPALLACGHSNDGKTFLPIGNDLEMMFGSAATASAVLVLFIYGWFAIRRMRGAIYGVPTLLTFMGLFTPIPGAAESLGIDRWMLLVAGSMVWLLITLRLSNSDWLWTLFTATTSVAIVTAADSYGMWVEGLIVAGCFATVAMLLIGAFFSTDLATFLRYVGAALSLGGVAGVTYRSVTRGEHFILYLALATGIVSLLYALWIRRRGWFAVAAIQTCLFLGAASYQGHRSGNLYRVNWSIASGFASLAVGLAITTGKTGLYGRLSAKKKIRDKERLQERQFLPGL